MTAREVNFDGLIGPTHNFGGLSLGNLASMASKNAVSRPRAAALQGLEKMRLLANIGVTQAVLPPQQRPDVAALRRLGFAGSDAEVLARAAKEYPAILAASASASSMWAANAATVSPSADAADGRVHITPANLIGNFHRSLEPPTTTRILRAIFSDQRHFAVHDPLPPVADFSDEGAANHTRLCADYGKPGLEVFTYGRDAAAAAGKFPARQSLAASEAIARLHQLAPARTLFLRQSPAAIEAGAFHHDVVAVGNLDCLVLHAEAFAEADAAVDEIRRRFADAAGGELRAIKIPGDILPLTEAVRTYLFNSQFITLPDATRALVAPMECRASAAARQAIAMIQSADARIARVEYVNVAESMGNGGGPACLRLRVALTDAELKAAHAGVFLTDALYRDLRGWIQRRYRETLSPAELADPKLLVESRDALAELTAILRLPAIYPFQM